MGLWDSNRENSGTSVIVINMVNAVAPESAIW